LSKGKQDLEHLKRLRIRAEKSLRKHPIEAASRASIKELVQELQVYQTELELQNEDLREAQAELEESRNKYFDLFDLAPVGYVTINRRGMVLEMNLTAANLLGIERRMAARKGFSRFVARDSQDTYYLHRSQVLETQEKQSCELKLLRNGRPFYAHLESTAAPDAEGDLTQLRITITDVTERVEMEQALRGSEEALRQSHNRLRQLSASLITAQEQERKRISRDLHDDMNQRLAVLLLETAALEKEPPRERPEVRKRLHSLEKELGALSDDLRRIAYQLHPAVLEHLGLRVALKSYCEDFSKRSRVPVVFKERNSPDSFNPEVALSLYRVAQEALANAVRHGNPTKIAVDLACKDACVALLIKDNGAGFGGAAKTGLGITSMEERARLVQGTLSIKSRPTRGTQVEVRVPLSGMGERQSG
jgi:PAS domain S-box-containing protein